MHKIGIIGGGQLGKMMILDAKRLDDYFVILDPTLHCPAHSIADEHIVADFDDVAAIEELASKVDVVTYEFEHISVKALQQVEAHGCPVYPSSETLLHIQNKYNQKQWLMEHGLPVPEFRKADSFEQLVEDCDYFGYPVILKTCTGGYDGKGNAVIHTREDIREAYESLGAGKLPLMVEEYVPFLKEVSILVCRSTNGDVAVFPVAENVHVNSILDETTVPADITEACKEEAMDVARKAVHAFNAYGMLCIELFVTKDQHVLVNELAPRPHNSGHYTIEGCVTSQYENHIRAILGLPLGSTELIRPTVMKNIIGTVNKKAEVHGLEEAYKYPEVKIHIYGKEECRVGRKMGHITVTDKTIEDALLKRVMRIQRLSFNGGNGNERKVGIIMGSDSDLPVMSKAAEILDELQVPYELTIVSAHRTPDRLCEYAKTAEEKGLSVIIAGAGGAAHLPGMTAAMTVLPVIGVPVQTKALGGVDSLYSIVQMPPGIPVATVAINGAQNAGLLAAKILATDDAALRERLKAYSSKLEQTVLNKADKLEHVGYEAYLKEM